MIETALYILLYVLYIVFVAYLIIKLIVAKHDPVKTITWVMIMLIIPVIGVILYLSVGRNLRRKKKKHRRNSLKINNYFEKLVIKQKFAITVPSMKGTRQLTDNKKIVNLLFNNNVSPITINNEVIVLNDGVETFPKIKEELNKAKIFIHLEYYIIENDIIGNEIADILIKKAKEGVEVRLIFDDVGSWHITKKYVKRLTQGGVLVEPYQPVIFSKLANSLNYRNHRKLINIDGLISFTGGLNIADRYIYGTKKLGTWRDTHIMIKGGASLALQALFANDWYNCHGEILDDAKYTPSPESIKNQCAIQIASSGPNSEWASIMQAFFSVITKAKNHIYISTPYFIPGNSILTAIKVAAMSGVDVKIMLPHKSDINITYYASRSYIDELLETGVKIYFYKPGFNHSKIIMADSNVVTVGTANMDVRSFEQNLEVTAIIYDEKTTKEVEEHFLNDLNFCDRIYEHEWNKRRNIEHLYEGLTRLFSPIL